MDKKGPAFSAEPFYFFFFDPIKPNLLFGKTGGIISFLIASKTTLKLESYFFSRASTFLARSALEANNCLWSQIVTASL